jgi:hypothetical protein
MAEEPKVDELKTETTMTWKDYSTTAIQWLSILGGIVWAIISGIKGDNTGLTAGITLAVTGLAGGKKGSILEDTLTLIVNGVKRK